MSGLLQPPGTAATSNVGTFSQQRTSVSGVQANTSTITTLHPFITNAYPTVPIRLVFDITGPQGPLGPNNGVQSSNPVGGSILSYNGVDGEFENSVVIDLPVNNQMSVSGAITIDRNNGEFQRLLLIENVTSINVLNWPASGYKGRLVLEVQNSGAFNIFGWPSGAIFPLGSLPNVTSGAGAKDLFVFMTFDGGNSVYCSPSGQNYQ